MRGRCYSSHCRLPPLTPPPSSGPLGRLEHRELAKCAASCGLSMLSGTEEEEGTGRSTLIGGTSWLPSVGLPLLRWGKLWPRLTLTPCWTWVQNGLFLCTRGWRKAPSPNTCRCPLPASLLPWAWRLPWTKARVGFLRLQASTRAAYLLPQWSCVWDPGGWGDLFYGIPGCKTGETRTRSGSSRPKANSRLGSVTNS